MRILVLIAFIGLSGLCMLPGDLSAQKAEQGDDFYGRKYALVIGNSKYEASPLANPERDAADIAATLAKTGFKVTTILNADKAAFQLALAQFESSLPKRAAVLVFYAGHAVQYQAQNFLLPVDALGKIKSASDLHTQGILLSDILEQLATRKDSIATIILDACRDSPFPNTPEISGGLSRSAGKSLADKNDNKGKRRKGSAMEGVIIAYSTAPDMTAADGEGSNSPYTKHLKEHLLRPNTTLESILKLTRVEVTKETGGKQTPWYETSINGDFYPAGQGRIEFEDLLKLLVPSTGGPHGGLRSWVFDDNLPDPIKWEDDGLSDRTVAGQKAPYFGFDNPPSYAYFRRGEVVILMDGKRTHDFKKGAATWQISLLGVRGGYAYVGLQSEIMGFGGIEAADGFGKSPLLSAETKCDASEGLTGTRVFKVKMPGHIPSWLAEWYTCGAANCQSEYMLFFDEKEKKTFGCR